MKIILVSRCSWTLYNFRAGLIRALRGKGCEVLGGGAGGDGFEARVEELGVSFRSLPIRIRGMNPIADLWLIYFLYRWYRSENPDVVHHFTIKPVIYGSIAARLAGVPRIVNTVTGLGFVFTTVKMTWLRALVEKMYRIGLGCANVVCFQNRDDRELFVGRGLVDAARTQVVPGSGVDTGRFVPSPRVAGEGIVFLFVGRILRDKGVCEFVEAARRVKAKHPMASFTLLGRRDERNPTVVLQRELDAWQEEGVVRWMGEVEDVRPVLAESDVVVLPSYREGAPRSLMEAAAMAMPIIATDVVGCREVVEDRVNGLLVPARDAVKLAEAMTWMIEHPEDRVRMGRAGRLKMENEFDERLVIEKTLGLYQSP